MKNQSQRAQYLAQGAMIGAIYMVLTLLAALANLAYGPVQFRFSEALTILPAFTPAAVPGLAVGCLLANIWSGYGAADMVFGTLATLLAAVCTRMVRNIRIKNLPVLAPLPPVLFNAVIIGLEIAVLSTEGFSWVGFWAAALSVGAGELVICYGLGLPLAAALQKVGKRRKIF
ncbi:QueT transporter family protein [Caproiciproducens sp. CPB-2]|uniref:QueT transporter family protein n=1 Tax=Caproiciproducens sp. CPB-2 TaxID=3030017 RepID=UPI0023DA31A7|nr:QueT transporter family protein [Caproiciproducens sp. CPB-2]MDF1496112.1 QueT transporter family protein [Caproiciproducens sp. CPB-2]